MPSLHASEIPKRLLREGICTPANVPSIRQIQTVTNEKLGMTYKKLTSIPSEYMTPENLAKVDDYSNITSRLKRETSHFFDEASVIVTSGNRMFGIEDNQRLKFKDMYQTPTTRYFAALFLSYALLKMQFFFLDNAYWNSRSNKLEILRQQFSYFGNDVLSYFFKRFA